MCFIVTIIINIDIKNYELANNNWLMGLNTAIYYRSKTQPAWLSCHML